MDMYRRNDFKSWFTDIGFLYLVVILVVILVFLLTGLTTLFSVDDLSVRRTASPYPYTEYAAR